MKFMKEILTNKKRLSDFETVNLTEECSAILQRKLPQKLKDSDSFTIPCTIGNSIFEKALCDIGEIINLMLLFIFRRLGLGEARPTAVTLQFADKSLKHLGGGGGGGGGGGEGGDRRRYGQIGQVHFFGRFHCSGYGRR